MSETIGRYPPAGLNYSGFIGREVYESGPNEVTLQDDPSVASGRPGIGIIIHAEDETDGQVAVKVRGRARGVLGATVTPGTDLNLMSDGQGRLIPATAGNNVIARAMTQIAGTVDTIIEIDICPHRI